MARGVWLSVTLMLMLITFVIGRVSMVPRTQVASASTSRAQADFSRLSTAVYEALGEGFNTSGGSSGSGYYGSYRSAHQDTTYYGNLLAGANAGGDPRVLFQRKLLALDAAAQNLGYGLMPKGFSVESLGDEIAPALAGRPPLSVPYTLSSPRTAQSTSMHLGSNRWVYARMHYASQSQLGAQVLWTMLLDTQTGVLRINADYSVIAPFNEDTVGAMLATLNMTPVAPPPPVNATVLVKAGSEWKYLDDGSDQGTAWRNAAFDDATWKTGPAPLGYGDQDYVTVVSYGSDAQNKHPTIYFRHAFDVADLSKFTGLLVRLRRDDGAAVYINGVEVIRDNLDADAPFNGFAQGNARDEKVYLEFNPDLSVLKPGRNVIAVEVHQTNRTSTDLGFDLELLGQLPGAATPETTTTPAPAPVPPIAPEDAPPAPPSP